MDAESNDGLSSLQKSISNLAKLIEDTSEGLQAELHDAVDRIEAATGRNTKMLTGGTRALSALNQWAEARDKLDRKRDAAIEELRTRVRKLERGTKRRA
jgi:L-lactate utilization protein LutB